MITNYDDHIDSLLDIVRDIDLDGKITLLTGSNASGKSLIRKQLAFGVAKKLGKDSPKGLVAGTSLEARTASNPEWGALSRIHADSEWMPSSFETFSNIERVLKIENQYLVIDEPELGMGEETVMALVQFLNDLIASKPKILGMMIITHNRYIVENLNFDVFKNTNGIKTKEDWLNRELIPTDLELLKANPLFAEIRKREKK